MKKKSDTTTKLKPINTLCCNDVVRRDEFPSVNASLACTGHGCPHDRDNCPRYKLYLSQDEKERETIENACAKGGC